MQDWFFVMPDSDLGLYKQAEVVRVGGAVVRADVIILIAACATHAAERLLRKEVLLRQGVDAGRLV